MRLYEVIHTEVPSAEKPYTVTRVPPQASDLFVLAFEVIPGTSMISFVKGKTEISGGIGSGLAA
jgi:hypothetical protein